VWTIVAANIITVALSFLFLKQLIRITYVRSNLLIPFVLMMIYLGAFAEKKALEDLILVLVFGGLGWTMQRLKWPRPPLILGIVLGPMVERRLFLSIENYGNFVWLLRPIVLVLIALTLVGVFYPMLKSKSLKTKAGKEEISTADSVSRQRAGRRSGWSVAFDLMIVIMLLAALLKSMEFPIRAWIFPWTFGLLTFLFSIGQLVMDLMGKEERGSSDQLTGADPDLPAAIVNRRTAGIIGWCVAYFVAIWMVGFPIGSALCLFIQLKIVDREKWPLVIIYTGLVWVFLYGFFDRFLKLNFPEGQLIQWLA
jgi:hypothetical protein